VSNVLWLFDDAGLGRVNIVNGRVDADQDGSIDNGDTMYNTDVDDLGLRNQVASGTAWSM
jgi:hypothetical protein